MVSNELLSAFNVEVERPKHDVIKQEFLRTTQKI
jgi:hypothetical protein